MATTSEKIALATAGASFLTTGYEEAMFLMHGFSTPGQAIA